MMKQSAVRELAADVLIPQLIAERERQIEFEAWAKGEHPEPFKPREANEEYQQLLEMSKVPLLGLVVRILAQSIELRDYLPTVEGTHDPLMAVWNGNRMGVRQKRLYRSVFRGGLGYAMSLPGEPVPVTKLYSAKNMHAVYQDAEADEWPMFGIYVETASATKRHFVIVDENATYRLEGTPTGDKLTFIEHQEHGIGIPPIVRYTGEMDDEGNVVGEVEPLIPIQKSIDQSKFDRLMTQSFNSWKIRGVTGMARPDSDEEARKQKMILERDRLLLIENPDGKVFSLDGTDIRQYIEAGRADKQDLASAAQISQKSFVGSQANNADGAEAQAAEEASTQRKIHDYEVAFGESHGQWFRLNGLIAGIDGAWEDYGAACDFVDSEIRSMSQMADSLGKIAAQLGVPKEGLWDMIPNVSPARITEWKRLLKEDPYSMMLEGLNAPDSAVQD